MTDEQFRFLLDQYGINPGGRPAPDPGPNLTPFFQNQPLEPSQLSPSPPFQFMETENTGPHSWVYPYNELPQAQPTGEWGQVPTFPNEAPAYASTPVSMESINAGNAGFRSDFSSLLSGLDLQMLNRAFEAGEIDMGPGPVGIEDLVNPNVPVEGYYPPEASMQNTGTGEIFDPNDYQPGALPTPTAPMFPPGMPPGQQMNFSPQDDYNFGQAGYDIVHGGGTPVVPLVGRPEGDLDPLQGFTGGDYGQGFVTNSVPNPEGGFWLYDQNWNYVGESDSGMVPSTTAYGSDEANTGGVPGPVTGPYAPPTTGANSILGNNPYSYGSPTAPGGPTAPSGQGAMGPNGQPIIDPMTGMPVAGSILSEGDVARRYNLQNLPEPGGFRPGRAAGNLVKDAAGNIIDATGKIVAAAGQAATDFIHNIMNDPRNTDPAYLASIGYREGQGTESQWPGSVTGPTPGPFDVGAYGVGGQGGSFFHGDILGPPPGGKTDVGPSAMNPSGYNYPRHGPTSLPGGGGAFGAGSKASLSTTMANAYNSSWLRRLQKGLVPIPSQPGYASKYPAPGLTNAGLQAGATQLTPGQYRQGMFGLQSFLQSNPDWINRNFRSGANRQGIGPGTNPPANQRGNVRPV
jgi:hypothetical protein